MRSAAILGLLALFPSFLSAAFPSSRDYNRYDYYAVHIDPSATPYDVASHLGLDLDGGLGELDDHYVFRQEKHPHNIVADAMREHRRRRKRSLDYKNDLLDAVLLHQKQKLRPPHEKRGPLHPYMPRPRAYPYNNPMDPPDTPEQKAARKKSKEIAKKLNITDPMFRKQWHLFNTMQLGHDLNVTGVWLAGITGKNSTVTIVDDGLDMDSEDIRDNYFAQGSYDFNDKSEEPRPRLDDDKHGTRCAGEVSAVKNDVCGVGVAWDSKVAGIRILSKPITDVDEAAALNYGYQESQIFSCSWGPPDDGTQMGAPGVLIKRAMLNAIQKGRGGLGTIYVFAAGNGASWDDNCNFDGYTNSIYSITVGAIDSKGKHPYYSEKCSAQLVVAYSSGGGDAIVTTDVGHASCYDSHGGTSAAGPLAVGVYALALEARPDLTWRDMQWITVLTAVKVKAKTEWQDTAIGKPFSHDFGFGKLDAWAVVEAARNHQLVKPQAWFFTPWQHVDHPIPEGNKGVSSHFEVTEEHLKEANLERVEHVTVTMNVKHGRRGDISVELRSPFGVVSHISTTRRLDEEKAGYVDWTFMSVAHWGETGIGKWTVIVKDTVENEVTGYFTDWKLSLFGECIDPEKQGLLPLPTGKEDEDDEGDREDAVVSTTQITTSTESDLPTSTPSDHPHRPTNVKPSNSAATEKPSSPSPTPSQGHHKPSKPNHHGHKPKPKPKPSAEPASDNLLPSPFPNFGVSKRTQIWIYGAAGLIIVFCLCLAVYFWMARKKRQRALAREHYEFEMIDEEDGDDGPRMNGQAGGSKGGKRRAGELYDAFAGESDEEMFSDEDEDAERRYRDRDSLDSAANVVDEKQGAGVPR